MESPLQGLTVVDLTRLLPGPFTSLVLADLGARVIKVESPSAPDILRFVDPYVDGSHVGFATLNRNKESVMIELTQPAGAAALRRLVSRADVFLTSTRPGWLEALGCGYEVLSRENPGLIMASLRGYASQSTEGHKGGHDINFLALSGLASAVIDASGSPVLPRVQLADVAGAMNGALAIMAALWARSRRGRGQSLEISLTESCRAFTVLLEAVTCLGLHPETLWEGPLSGRSPMYRYYRCADGLWLAVGAVEVKYQRRLLQALKASGEPSALPDCEHWPEDLFMNWSAAAPATEALEALFARRSRDAWVEYFATQDVCLTPVLSLAEASARELPLRVCSTSEGERVTQPAGLLDRVFPATGLSTVAPPAGTHTRAVLRELGYTHAEIAAWVAQGIALEAPTTPDQATSAEGSP